MKPLRMLHIFQPLGLLVFLVFSGCNKGDPGPSGPRGLRGYNGLPGETGGTGATGETGIQGTLGPQGTQGTAGTSCTPSQTDAGTQIICVDGNINLVLNGQNGTNGSNGLNGTNGSDGTSCTLQVNDGGRQLVCANGTSSLFRSGQAGINGTSCFAQESDGGLAVICDDGTNSFVGDGFNGTNGINGEHGLDGGHGAPGSSCAPQETDGGVLISCTDDTTAFIRDGRNGLNGKNGNNGDAGDHGEGCQITPVGNGVSINCATGSQTVYSGTNCTITDADAGLEVECPQHTGGNTSASLAYANYVEPYGISAVMNVLELIANNALFVLFDAPASGVFDHFRIFQGDQFNVLTGFELEIAIFEQAGDNWQLLEGSEVVLIPQSEAHAFDHQTYFRSGLNARLTQGYSYLFVIRHKGAAQPPNHNWRYNVHTVYGLPGSAQYYSWTRSVSTSLESYTTTIANLNGSRNIPWFRLTQ